MGRRTTISDEQILEAARGLFLEEGFNVQTSKIARRAGVSEGSIFNRFPTKEALFFASLLPDHEPRWRRRVEELSAEWRGEEGLKDLLIDMLESFSEAIPLILVMVGSRIGAKISPLDRAAESPRNKDLKVLSEFFQAQIEAGTVRPFDPQEIASFVLASTVHRVFEAYLNGCPLQPADFPLVAERTVDLVWRGIGRF